MKTRVKLGRITISDRANMVRILTNDKVKQTYMIPDFASEDEVIALFDRFRTYSERDDHFDRGIYLNGELIGFLNDVYIEGSKIELGYALHPDYHNNGYATEALSLAINELFQKGFAEIVAGAFTENPASFRVMQKCGMTPTGEEEFIEYKGVSRRCLYYSILKS